MIAQETQILDTTENGIFVLDDKLNIQFWNNWLAVNTQISKVKAHGKNLEELYPHTSFCTLKRKIKIALKLGSSTYANSTLDKYIVPIELDKVTSSHFRHMRQDCVITPLNDKEVSVVLYDTTPLLEAKAIIDEQLLIVKRQATTDTLTNCFNRKMFHEMLTAEISRSERHNLMFSLVIFDIDNFKLVNDTFGHLVGDEVLKSVAQIGSTHIRKSDIFARWGGEEFTILLPETDLEGAVVVAEKVRHAIETFHNDKVGYKTCSFGIAEFEPHQPDAINLIISRADKALYYAKENGKNMVAIFTEDKIKKIN